MIRIENVSFSFGDKKIIRDFDLDVTDRITVLTGPSGCGKTTLLRLIAGLLEMQSGKITGVPEKISFLFQDDRLLPWLTVRENTAAVLLRGDSGAEADKWIERLELSDVSGKRPDEISGGQRRRAAMARALAYGGELLILDEPMKGLDEALIRKLIPMIKDTGADVIVTSHSEFETELWGGTVVTMKRTERH